jgi:hypothetical protein
VVSAQARETTTSAPEFEKVMTDIASTNLVTKSLVENPEAQVLTSTTSAIDDATLTTIIAITADAEITTLASVAGKFTNMLGRICFKFLVLLIIGVA